VHRGEQHAEIEVLDAAPHGLIQLGQPVQDPTLELRHLSGFDALLGIEPSSAPSR